MRDAADRIGCRARNMYKYMNELIEYLKGSLIENLIVSYLWLQVIACIIALVIFVILFVRIYNSVYKDKVKKIRS